MQVPFFHYLPISCLSSQWGGGDSLLFPHLSPSSHGSSSTPYTVVTGRYLHRSTLSESEECTFSVGPASSSKHNGVGGCLTGPVTRKRSRGDRCCWHKQTQDKSRSHIPKLPQDLLSYDSATKTPSSTARTRSSSGAHVACIRPTPETRPNQSMPSPDSGWYALESGSCFATPRPCDVFVVWSHWA
jgi:hypothetical protein